MKPALIDLVKPKLFDFDLQRKLLTQNQYTARRFIFDAEASRRVGEIMTSSPDLVAQNIEFARQPYPSMYIELDALELFKGRGGIPEPTADTRIGYLSVNGATITLAEGPESIYKHARMPAAGSRIKTTVGPVPFMFSINKPQGLANTTLFHVEDAQEATILKAVWVLGGQRSQNRNEAFSKASLQQAIFMPDIGMSLEQFIGMVDVRPALDIKPNGDDNPLVNYAFAGGGDPFIYTTALLLLNRENKNVYIREKGPQRGLHNGKAVVYRTHSLVSISLSDKGSIRQLIVGDRSSPRRHEVRGTWVNQDKHYCEHDWEPEDMIINSDGSVGKRFHCTKCPQRRTWRETHIRGDGSKGWVVKHYEVHK